MSAMSETLRAYFTVYSKAFFDFWNYMTPPQYATLLMIVAFFGFMTMGSKSR